MPTFRCTRGDSARDGTRGKFPGDVSRRASERAAASVEAVVALPVLILLLFGVMYVANSATARHEAEGLARTCAWKYAQSGCRAKDVLRDFPQCEGVALSQVDADYSPVFTEDMLKQGLKEGFSSGVDGVYRAILSEFLTRAIQDLALKALTREGLAKRAFQVKREGLSGAPMESLQARYQLPCNVASSSPTKLATDFFKALVL